jgi:fucose permease
VPACLTFVYNSADKRLECLDEVEQGPTEDELAAQNSQGNAFSKVMRLRAVHFLAIYILIYVGVEVTMGGKPGCTRDTPLFLTVMLSGWMVTFIINARGGGPSSGYVSSGFFGGLTLGRVVLLWVNEKVGERRVVFLYSAIAIG